MTRSELYDCLADCPVIAAVHENRFEEALRSPAGIIFLLGGSILTVKERISRAHGADKKIFIHIDLAEGIGKDKAGTAFLADCGADGIISTKASIIRAAKECEIVSVQRFFALDSQGVNSISEMIESSRPDLIEIMPGVASKVIRHFSGKGTPVIAGGLIESKAELTEALASGAEAVSTGKEELWYM